MALEPYYVKVVWPDGKVGLFDRCKRKVFLVNPARKAVRIVIFGREVTDKYADIYDSIRNFRNMPGYSIERTGRRRIDQTQAIGFRLTDKKGNEKIIVWTDPCSQLPMYIEFFGANELGQMETQMIWSDIVFDVELDESLFKFDLEGYKVEELDSLQLE